MKLVLCLLVAFLFVATLASATSLRRRERAYRDGLLDGLGIDYGRYNDDIYYGRGRRYRESRDRDYYLPRPIVQSVPSSAGSSAAPGSTNANIVLGSDRGTTLGARSGSEQSYGTSRTNSEVYGSN